MFPLIFCSPEHISPATPPEISVPPDELRWYVFPLHVDMCFPWLCVPFASILVHALVYSVSCRFSLSKEETWRFSGLLIAGPECSVITELELYSCSRQVFSELSVVSFPPGSCTVVLTSNHQKTAERGRLYISIEWHNHGSSHSHIGLGVSTEEFIFSITICSYGVS